LVSHVPVRGSNVIDEVSVVYNFTNATDRNTNQRLVWELCPTGAPYINTTLPGNRGSIVDRNRVLTQQLFHFLNRDIPYADTDTFYKVAQPYLQLVLTFSASQGMFSIGLDVLLDRLHDRLVDQPESMPLLTSVPLFQYVFSVKNTELCLKVNDMVLPVRLPEEVDLENVLSNTPLFAHQAVGSQWILEVEGRVATGEPQGFLTHWMPVENDLMDWDATTCTLVPHVQERPRTVELYSKGGMIGDGIGSGKTLQMLHAIVKDLDTLRTRGAAGGAAGVPGALETQATLVVCGKQLAEQWKQQVMEHFPGNRLNIVVLTNKVQHDQLTYESLLQADIVIVTMSFLCGEYYRTQFLKQRINNNIAPMQVYVNYLNTLWPTTTPPGLRRKPVLEHITFRRVVLDEADMYLHKLPYADPNLLGLAYNNRVSAACKVNSSRKTEPFIYVHCLKSRFRWVMTSTADFRDVNQKAAFVTFLQLETRFLPMDHQPGHSSHSSHSSSEHGSAIRLTAPRAWTPHQALSLDTAMQGPSVTEQWLMKQAFTRHLLLARSQEFVFNSMALPDLETSVLWIDYTELEKTLVKAALELPHNLDGQQALLNYQRQVHAFPLLAQQQLHGGGGGGDGSPGTLSRPMTVQEARDALLVCQRQRLLFLETCLEAVNGTLEELEQAQQATPASLQGMMNLRHSQLVTERSSTQSQMEALHRSMQYIEASLASTDPCAICFEGVCNMLTLCGHRFCRPCLQQALQTVPKCPICRAGVTLQSCIVTVNAPEEKKETEEERYGSRFCALLHYIRTTRADDPSSQFVVFSEWAEELQKQQQLLSKYYRCAQIKGNTAVCQSHVTQFQHKEIDVLFLSLQSMASGLNLMVANHVVILTPLGAPYDRADQVERQAIGRCHRVGQTRVVHVRHILVRNSLEENIYYDRVRGAQ